MVLEIYSSFNMTPDQIKKILDERADRLALVRQPGSGNAEKREYLSFICGGDSFLIQS